MTILLAGAEAPTEHDRSALRGHVEECDACRQLATQTDVEYRWVVRIPQSAADNDRDLHTLPIVDPLVFATEAELARGGMGRITRARDRRLGREVAIKEVLDPVLRARFEREAIITASLQHPAIVPIYEAGTWPDGSSFYAMRLVSGGTLHDAIAKTTSLEGRLALLPHVRAVTEALAYAHSKRIVHRDLKPGNVLVGEFGETVVIDWGLAKQLDGPPEEALPNRPSGGDLTRVGAVMGTVGFMSPEQAFGLEVDERADVYALGAILYNVLAGHPPVATLTADAPTAVHDAAPTPIAELAAGAPADLRAIVERAMARPASARFATAKEMAEELRRFEAGQLLRTREYGFRELAERWIRRHRGIVIIGGIALAIVGIVGIGAIIGIARSRAAERDARQLAEQARGIAEQAQGSAEQARTAADRDAISLLEEQGRDELLDGDRERALTYLSEAYHRGRDTIALRHLLAAATRDLSLADHVIDPARGIISSIGFTADGRAVTVDASDEGSIGLWERDKPVVSHAIGTAVERSRISPDGRRAVVITDDQLAMYDTATGTRLWSIRDAKFIGPTIVFDRADKFVVMSGWDKQSALAQLRDVATGALVTSLVAGTAARTAAAFSPGGQFVATGDMEGTVAAWDVRTGARVLMAKVTRPITAIAFAADDHVVAGTDEREAWVWHFGAPTPIALTGHHGAITVVAANDWGDMIAIGDATGAVHLWNQVGELLGESHDARGSVEELLFSPEQDLLLGGGADKRAYVWEVPSLALRRAITAYHGAPEDPRYRNAEHGLAWSHDQSHFATVGSGERHASVWRTPKGPRVERFWSRASALADTVVVTAFEWGLTPHLLATGTDLPNAPLDPQFPRVNTMWAGMVRDFAQTSRDGKRALLWGTAASEVVDVASGARLGTVPTTKESVGFLAPTLTADGKLVLEVDRAGARLVDPVAKQVAHQLAIAGALDGAISADGDHLVLAFGDTPARLFRITTNEELASHAGPGRHVRFDPSGRYAVVYGTAAATVLDATTGAALATFGGPGNAAIEDAKFSADGHRVATWARDRSAKLWDVGQRAPLVAVEGVAWRAFTPSADGLRFATGSDDGNIQLWDATTGRLLDVIHGDRGVTELAWSADSTRLLAQFADEHAAIWDVHLEQRTPAEIAELTARASGWILADGLLIPRAPATP